nr:heptaprenyl diphosphate synthase component 1 [Bacillus sp. B15-48]
MQEFEMKIERVRNKLSDKLNHPYLLQNIAAPIIDEDKLCLLVSLLNQHRLTMDEINNYAVTTTLLQIALDTHEHVQNGEPLEDASALKDRQLTVLAGTYYSGLFYKQLANVNKIEIITTLAAGVKEINEHKISVYHKDSEAIDRLMKSVKIIESSLLGRLADVFHVPIWKEFAANLLFVKRMIKEQNHFIQTGKSIVFEGLKKIALSKNNQELTRISNDQQKYLLSICERYIDYSITIIEDAIIRLPTMDKQMQNRAVEILGQRRSITKFILEEG